MRIAIREQLALFVFFAVLLALMVVAIPTWLYVYDHIAGNLRDGLAKDENGAMDALAKALAVIREPWEPETTARNLQLIRTAREARKEAPPWATEIENELNKMAKP